jgi:hypothetical protein
MNERKESAADKAFVEQARKHFDHSVENLDAGTRSKLNRSRQAALANLGSGGQRWLVWAPAGGVAAAAVLALALWSGGPSTEQLLTPAADSDIEILLTEDSLEMLEDLEFYSWIELDEDGNASDGNVG